MKAILQPVASHKLFIHKTLRLTIPAKTWCQQQWTEFSNILHLSVHGSNSFVGKPSPNIISYPVKNSSSFKISGSLLLSSPKISTGVSKKKCFVATATSVPSQHRWSQLFPIFAPAIRANILTSIQDFFVFKQPIKKIRINSKILCLQSPLNFVPRPLPAKRSKKGYGTRMPK